MIRRFTMGQGSPRAGFLAYEAASAARTWSCNDGGVLKDDAFEIASGSLKDSMGVAAGEDRLRFAAVLGITPDKLNAIAPSGNEMRWRWGRNPGEGTALPEFSEERLGTAAATT